MKKYFTQKFITKLEGRQAISDKFHIATNTEKLDPPNRSSSENIPKSWIKIHFKIYPRLNKIRLNKVKFGRNKLITLFKKRFSARHFSTLPITKDELSYLLYASSGLINLGRNLDESRRPYPSAGARYPLEVYPLIMNCKGIKSGLYHYNVKENLLELLLEKDLVKWVLKNTSGDKWIATAGALFIITGVLDRTRIKYRERGYRYALLEAGHLGQNICLTATELGLGSCALGGYIDKEFDKLLDIDLQEEFTLYMIAVGKL